MRLTRSCSDPTNVNVNATQKLNEETQNEESKAEIVLDMDMDNTSEEPENPLHSNYLSKPAPRLELQLKLSVFFVIIYQSAIIKL